MSIKSILSVYSGEAAHGSGLRHALKLAQHYDGWMTGSLIRGHSVLERRFAPMLSDTALKSIQGADEDRVSGIRARFELRLTEAGRGRMADFIECDSDETLAAAARSFDLVVMGPHHAEPGEDHLSAHPEYVATHSGRPVLIIPDDYDASGLAQNALVAWDGRRSCARALGDALPVLEEKATVTILTAKNITIDHDSPTSPLKLLERHGINAIYRHVAKSPKSVGSTILQVAQELDAKLIVMGAFERSRLAQDIIGGSTREVMRNSDVPVFLSH